MSATREELVDLFREAERRNDRPAAEAIMAQIENFQESPQQSAPQDLTYFQRLGRDLTQRGEEIQKLTERVGVGDLDPKLGFIRVAEEVGGGIWDLTPEWLQDWVSDEFASTGRGIAALTPQGVKDTVATVAEPAFDKAGEFAAKHPDLAEAIIKSPDLFPLFAPAAVKPAARDVIPRHKFYSKGGDITPWEHRVVTRRGTTGAMEDAGHTTTSRWTQKAQTIPDKRQIEIVEELRKVKNDKGQSMIRLGNTNRTNLNAIDYGISMEGKALFNTLKKQNIRINKAIPLVRISKNIQSAMPKEAVFASSQTSRNQVKVALQKVARIIDRHDGSAHGLLQARKELDAYYYTTKKRIFKNSDGLEITSPEARAYEIARTTINELIAEKAPSVAVKESLLKQRRLYQARDIVAPKAWVEPKTMWGRTKKRMEEALPRRHVIISNISK